MNDHEAVEADTEWVIRPYEGAGPIDFGMTRDQVEAILGPSEHVLDPARQWRKSSIAAVSFDVNGLCEYMDFSPPAVTIVEGIRLQGACSALIQLLQGRGCNIGVYGEGLTLLVPELGVLIAREDPDDEDEEIIHTGAYRLGWWEEMAVEVRKQSKANAEKLDSRAATVVATAAIGLDKSDRAP